MDTKRVPNLDWPRDLFRGVVAAEPAEHDDNPFLEEADFQVDTVPLSHAGLVRTRGRALAM